MNAPLLEPGATLGRADLEGPVLEVAPRLLGCLLTHAGVTVRLTEVEAYAGTDDPGSHAFRGPTPRTEVMFGPAGHLYVYLSYGMHRCVNVVTGAAGRASAVLLRAGSVVRGAEQARARREAGRRTPVRDRDLARGPGVLTQALDLGAAHHGLDLTAQEAPVLLVAGAPVDARRIRTGPRVGVSGEGGDGDVYPWRFWIEGEETVSAYRPAPRRLAGPTR
jgi:DNA-3-methyladenine glycosylase